jgi:hypothetical protein
MSTLSNLKLSPYMRQKLIDKIRPIWTEVLSDDIESVVNDGFTGLKDYSDYELICEYETMFTAYILDSSENEYTDSRDDFINELKLDIATNRMLYAESKD